MSLSNKFVQFITQLVSKKEQAELPQATVYTRAQHTLSRKQVSRNALTVLYRLHDAGYKAFLVGGCVRDLLLQATPKDFDVVTDANPEQIRKLFRNCRLIGRRFRLVHVYFGHDIIEVATFRGIPSQGSGKYSKSAHSGMVLRDNEFGTIEEDALRRDFTVNALYYNIADFSIHDYANGIEDIQSRTLRLIGNPALRYEEDPVRMLRAIRFATKLDFMIEAEASDAITAQRKLLANVPSARLFEEILKLFMTGYAAESIATLREYQLHDILFPNSEHYEAHDWKFIELGFANTDQRYENDETVSPSFLFALLLWPAYMKYAVEYREHNSPLLAKYKAMDKVILDANPILGLPKRITLFMRSVWEMQDRLVSPKRHQIFRLLSHPYYRASFDFLVLRCQAKHEDRLAQQLRWWSEFSQASPNEQEELLKTIPAQKKRGKKKTQ